MSPLRSIRGRLLIFGLCISLIPIAIITTVGYFYARSTLKKETLEWMTAVAESRKAHVLEFIEGERRQVVDFSSDGFITYSLERINSGGLSVTDNTIALNDHLLRNKKPLDPYITLIEIVDLNGRIVGSTDEATVGRNIAERGSFATYMDKIYKEPRISLSHPHPAYLDVKGIDISAPITSGGGTGTLGAIINHYDLEVLGKITANRAGMGETGEVVLGQREGEGIIFLNSLRYAPGAPLSLSVLPDSMEAEPMRLALEGKSGALIAPDYRGVNVVAAYQNISPLGWGLVAKIDESEAFAPLKTLGMVALIVGLVGAAAVVSVGIIFATSTSRPIRKLTDATRRFARGDLKSRVSVRRKDEIGELGESFNTMAGELETLTGSLEQRVAERTAELAKKYEELQKEITERKRVEEELKRTTEQLSLLVESLPIITYTSKLEGDYGATYVSANVTEVTGYRPEDFTSDDTFWAGRIHPDDRQGVFDGVARLLESGHYEHEYRWRVADGSYRWFVDLARLARSPGEGKGHIIGVWYDVTERKRAEGQVKASLKEKEELLGEIHHRVKNNLQIISSLLDMRSMRTQNKEAIDLFADARNKIHTMGLIHTELYQSERFDQIDLKDYVRKLAEYLSQVYGAGRYVTLDVKGSGVYLTVTQAIPCALALNELITNAFKHAFGKGQKGRLEISVQKPSEDTVSIMVKDDGAGIPEEVDIYKTDSLGLKLVRNLVEKQLKGKIRVKRDRGTEFVMEFKPLKEDAEGV